MQLNDDQLKAIDNAIKLPFSLITGGAGTGKTTIIKEIANQIKSPVTLCCPTGKAAARLREASGMNAKTIHSVLQFNGEKFMAGKMNGDTIIIDEASMVEASVLSEIVKRNPDRIVLVGDNAQLHPVGPGAPFHDIIQLRPELTTELKICYRNSEAIYKAASAIRTGNVPLKQDKSENEYWEIRHTGDIDNTLAYLINEIQAGKIDFEQDIILAYKNDTVQFFNKKILEIVNPHHGEKWEIGDRVICLKNFSDFDTWNGTTGTITAIDTDKKCWVRGDIPFWDNNIGEYVDEIQWDKEILQNSQHAYALTVHKSQGSQYRNVYFCLFGADSYGLTRSLIYTAVTRARKQCIVLGDSRVFYRGISQQKEKLTVLKELAQMERRND